MAYTTNDVKNMMVFISNRVIEIKDELTDIDSKLGDGDMGMSMSKGAMAVIDAVHTAPEDADLTKIFLLSASALNKAAPSTMGTLLSGALLAVGKSLAGKTQLEVEDIIKIPTTMADAIAARGRAKVGDKTILDAFIPYAQVLKEVYQEKNNFNTAKVLAYESAVQGMESTKGIKAKTGRASWLGERNMEYPDGGAYMLCKVTEVL